MQHSRATRTLHVLVAIATVGLIWSALLLLSGTPELPWSHWISPQLYAAFHVDNRNEEGRVWHVALSFATIALACVYAAWPQQRDAHYNQVQRFAHRAFFAMLAGEIITGLPIYFHSWTWMANAFGGQIAIRFEHFVLMLGIVFFIAVHLFKVATAGRAIIRGMLSPREAFAVLVLLALALAFAHAQSANADRVPLWLNWARDTED